MRSRGGSLAPASGDPRTLRYNPRVITKKADKPVVARGSSRAPVRSATAVARSRPRAHSLAPEHVGEAGSVAVLVLCVIGLALLITAIAIVISGMTVGARYTGSPPPNVGSLGLGQIVAGVGLGVYSIALVGASLGVLADVRLTRAAAAALSGLGALLAAGGIAWIMSRPGGDQVFAGALAVVAITFAAAAVLLARRPR